PPRDLNDLARRFKPGPAHLPTGEPPPAAGFTPGDTDTFWVVDNSTDTPSKFQVTARLVHRAAHSYWWVQQGYTVSEADIAASARQFEDQTYPTNRRLFGSEWSPGIDGDVRVHILMGNIPGVSGYFSASNEYLRQAVSHSNQREMFLINLAALQPGSRGFDGVLAHEFQHMIHWRQDPNEDSWVNEGLSELAEFVNGFGLSEYTRLYLQNPNLQLTSWGREAQTRRANYGASFLFALYLYDKFGPEVIQQLVRQPQNGAAGVEATLRRAGLTTPFDALFADFVVANYLNDPALAQGQWGYSLSDVQLPAVQFAASRAEFPVEAAESGQQYGAKYIQLAAAAPVTVTFTGAATVTLLPNRAHSGRYQWYGNRADNSDTTLTRPFDLTGLSEATLEFWAWYDIEVGWDYAYVAVSTDGGSVWKTLPASSTVATNPVGNAYGPGFTGASGPEPGWLKQVVDLSPFAGQEILLRFEYITDDAVNLPGFAVDDIAIPQLGYSHTAEQGDGGWEARGFIRTDNVLPQRFTVWAIEMPSAGPPVVAQIPLNRSNAGQFTFGGLGTTVERAVLIISPQAPVTTIPARYTYTLRQP
ncbi:MAG: DUF6055 domain-containing protein, partial [Anaerolineae bacterium]